MAFRTNNIQFDISCLLCCCSDTPLLTGISSSLLSEMVSESADLGAEDGLLRVFSVGRSYTHQSQSPSVTTNTATEPHTAPTVSLNHYQWQPTILKFRAASRFWSILKIVNLVKSPMESGRNSIEFWL